MGELEIHQHVKLFQDGSKSGNPRNFGINAIFTSRITWFTRWEETWK